MKLNSELRRDARQALKGNWLTSALFTLVYLIIACIISAVFTLPAGQDMVWSQAGSFLAAIIAIPFAWAFTVSFLRQFRGEEQQIGWLFAGYSKSRVWTTEILKGIYVTLWSLLLIIPGIVKNYSYAMTEYILQDNPDMSNNAAIEESMKMMDGRRWKLFLLDLSFIGWFILSCLTFFIGCFWLIPYIESARAAFYEDAKREYYGATE